MADHFGAGNIFEVSQAANMVQVTVGQQDQFDVLQFDSPAIQSVEYPLLHEGDTGIHQDKTSFAGDQKDPDVEDGNWKNSEVI